jgi:hypothetical protein
MLYGIWVPYRLRRSFAIYKVKCTLVQALRICTGLTAHRGRRSIALLFHDHGIRRAWGVSVTPRPLFNPGKEPVPIVQGDCLNPRAGLDRCVKSCPHRDFFLAWQPPLASSLTGFLDHTQRRTTIGRTSQDEWLARRRDLYLTTHNTHNRHTCPWWDSNPQSQQASGCRPTA